MLDVQLQDRALRRTLSDLEQAGRNVPRTLQPVALKRMRMVMGAAKDDTPVDKGYLRRSGQSSAEVVGDEVHGQVLFGGLAWAYAAYQHEHDRFKHVLPPGVSRTMTKRKFRQPNGRLAPRKRKHPLRGYRGGHAHWLYGRYWSAWDSEQEAALSADMLRAARDELQKALGNGS